MGFMLLGAQLSIGLMAVILVLVLTAFILGRFDLELLESHKKRSKSGWAGYRRTSDELGKVRHESRLLIEDWCNRDTFELVLVDTAKQIERAISDREKIRENLGKVQSWDQANSLELEKLDNSLSAYERLVSDLTKRFWRRHDYVVKLGFYKKPWPSWKNFLLTADERAAIMAEE
ncbi:MAG: hypothetical protein AAB590_02925 [Patescibacteria group bacterium]